MVWFCFSFLNCSQAQKSSSLTNRHLNWGAAADNVRSVTTVGSFKMLLRPRMMFLVFIIWRDRGESSGSCSCCCSHSGHAHTRSAVIVAGGTWVPLLLIQASAVERSFPGAEKLRNEKGGEEVFLSCSRVAESLQLLVCTWRPITGISFPLFIIHIRSIGYLSLHLRYCQESLAEWKSVRFSPILLPDVQHLKLWSWGNEEQCGTAFRPLCIA